MDEKRKKTITIFLLLIIASLLLIGLDKCGWLNWLKSFSEKIANPIRVKIHQNNSKRVQKKLSRSESTEISKKNDFLERENAGLQVVLEQLKSENAAMRKLLGAPLPPNWQFIPVSVLEVSDGIMVINQGSNNGLKEGQTVVYENVLMGRIFKVNPNLSKIMLPLNKDSQVQAKIVKTDIKGVVKVYSNKVLVLDEVLQEELITPSQIVVTSGKDSIYPENLLIAKIESIEKDEAQVYQKAILKPLLDYQKLETVFVIKN